MATTRGRIAEDRACEYLVGAGLTILTRNWRNRWCEIDIVARGSDTVHIVEVKYRSRTAWGEAIEYVTADKVERLRRAASAWQQATRYDGQIQIDVVTVEGDLDAPKIAWLPNAVTD